MVYRLYHVRAIRAAMGLTGGSARTCLALHPAHLSGHSIMTTGPDRFYIA